MTGVSKVFYTVNFGSYDPTHDSEIYTPIIEQGWDVILFTDNTTLTSTPTRQVIVVPLMYNNPRLTAKYYKLHPHRVLPAHYTHSLFSDARLLPTSDLLATVAKYSATGGEFLAFRHKERECIYDEGKIVSQLKLDWSSRVDHQMTRYRELGFPAKYGLIDSACLFRSHHSPEVVRLHEYWYHEVMSGSTRDQLSFNFVLWYLQREGYSLPQGLEMMPYLIIGKVFKASPGHTLVKRFVESVIPWKIAHAKCLGVDVTAQLNRMLRNTSYQYLHISSDVSLDDPLLLGPVVRKMHLNPLLSIDGQTFTIDYRGGRPYLDQDVHILPPKTHSFSLDEEDECGEPTLLKCLFKRVGHVLTEWRNQKHKYNL